jgi:hypothetical protein
MAPIRNEMTVGVLVGVVDTLIWTHFLPSIADIKEVSQFNGNIEQTERTALVAASAFTLISAGFARSAKVFAIGGLVIVALDYATKHANAVNPQTGKMAQAGEGQATSYPMPDYS